MTSVPVCLLQKDLIYTIGESAALGAAGFVIWGDLNLTSSRVGVPSAYLHLTLHQLLFAHQAEY